MGKFDKLFAGQKGEFSLGPLENIAGVRVAAAIVRGVGRHNTKKKEDAEKKKSVALRPHVVNKKTSSNKVRDEISNKVAQERGKSAQKYDYEIRPAETVPETPTHPSVSNGPAFEIRSAPSPISAEEPLSPYQQLELKKMEKVAVKSGLDPNNARVRNALMNALKNPK